MGVGHPFIMTFGDVPVYPLENIYCSNHHCFVRSLLTDPPAAPLYVNLTIVSITSGDVKGLGDRACPHAAHPLPPFVRDGDTHPHPPYMKPDFCQNLCYHLPALIDYQTSELLIPVQWSQQMANMLCGHMCDLMGG